MHDTTIFHAYIKNKKKVRVGAGPLKFPGGQNINDPLTMADVFAVNFISVYSVNSCKAFGGTIGDLNFTPESVVNAFILIPSQLETQMSSTHIN